MGDWINVDDSLPEIGEWVSVFQNKGAYSDMDENEMPEYWYPDECFAAKVSGLWMSKVTSAQLRDIDEEGYASWEQGRIASGHSLWKVHCVTHWMPLPEPPE